MITIDKNKCKKCNACVSQCPYNFIFSLDVDGFPQSTKYFDNHCIKCFHCVTVCKNRCLSHPLLSSLSSNELDELEINTEQVSQLLKTRRSIRAFKRKKIEQKKLEELMDLTRWSSTANNSQEIRWLIINSSETIQAISKHIIDWLKENQSDMELVDAWNNGQDMVLRDAPHLAIAIFNKDRYWAFTEASSALTYLELAAKSLQIGACWAGYFTRAANEYKPLKSFLNIPETDNVFGAMMLGYPKFKFPTIPKRKESSITWLN